LVEHVLETLDPGTVAGTTQPIGDRVTDRCDPEHAVGLLERILPIPKARAADPEATTVRRTGTELVPEHGVVARLYQLAEDHLESRCHVHAPHDELREGE
jgi:hypothetical protein